MTRNDLNTIQELLVLDNDDPVMDLLRCFHDPVSEGLENRQIRPDEEWNEPAWCEKYARCMAEVERKLYSKRKADFGGVLRFDGVDLSMGGCGPYTSDI